MFTYITWTVLLVVLFHLFVFHKYNWPRYVRMIDKIPGPRGVFYFGSVLRFCQLRNEEILPELMRDFKTYGSTVRYWYNGLATVFISELDDIQVILGSRLKSRKGVMYKYLLPWLGTGLLTSGGEKWHRMRKIITPTFHFSILHGYIDIFNKNANRLIKLLEEEVDSAEVDLAKYITYCTLDNICETSMGIQLDSMTSGDENNYVQSIFRMGKIVMHRLFSPIMFTDRNFRLTPLGWEHSKLLKILHGFTSKIIEEKRLELIRNSDSNHHKTKKSLLEMLLQNQLAHSLTDEAIREQVDTFMFEGHDTTAASLNWALFELGQNQEIQEAVHKEMMEIFGKSNRSPNYQDLMQMTYTKRVIQEVLRLHPSVPVISRKFDVDLQIKDYLIPADTDIVLVLYYLHRNPKIFPEPEKFDPDRFLPQQIDKRHPFAYIPFSAGSRNCIGQKFALLEVLVTLSSIIRKYRILSLDDPEFVEIVPEMILRPGKRFKWKIIKR